MNEPQISLSGNLARDPQLRFTPNGVAVADLRLASTQRRKVGEEWLDGETLWFDVACWKQLGEHVASSLKKGDRVVVSGRLAQRSWVRDDGTSGSTLVVDASSVGVDLSRFPVTVMRTVRPGSAAEAFPDRWVDAPAGAAPLGDPGPLVPAAEQDERAA